MSDLEQTVRSGETPFAIWWSVGAGFVAWGLDLGLSYMLDQHACSTGHVYVLHLVSLACLGIALSGFLAGYREFQRIGEPASSEGRRPIDRAYFQAILGMLFSAGFAVVVIADALPRWILSPCD